MSGSQVYNSLVKDAGQLADVAADQAVDEAAETLQADAGKQAAPIAAAELLAVEASPAVKAFIADEVAKAEAVLDVRIASLIERVEAMTPAEIAGEASKLVADAKAAFAKLKSIL